MTVGAQIDRILFVSADVPWPPDGGGRIASLRVLEGMARHSVVDLIALADPMYPLDLTYLRDLCAQVHVISQPFTFRRHPARQIAIAARSALSRDPYRLRKFRNRELDMKLHDLVRTGDYKLVHLEQFGVSTYGVHTIPTTHVTQNIESAIYKLGSHAGRSLPTRMWARLESNKLRFAERHIYPSLDHVFVLSAHDLELLNEMGMNRASVLPIPVDVEPSPPSSVPAQPVVLTLGSMSWFGVEDGLMWFHELVWPTIRRLIPGAKWNLVGPNPGPRIKAFDGYHGVRVHGYVPDISPFVNEARAVVVPLHIAGGIRIKLIELLARGRPCVTTTIGAQGLSFADGEGAYRRDDPDAFARAVVGLLQDDTSWKRLSDLGVSYVNRNHTVAKFDEALEAGINAAVRNFRNRA
jgi:glycosyltransferase involved in cell wall biosynthesis